MNAGPEPESPVTASNWGLVQDFGDSYRVKDPFHRRNVGVGCVCAAGNCCGTGLNQRWGIRHGTDNTCARCELRLDRLDGHARRNRNDQLLTVGFRCDLWEQSVERLGFGSEQEKVSELCHLGIALAHGNPQFGFNTGTARRVRLGRHDLTRRDGAGVHQASNKGGAHITGANNANAVIKRLHDDDIPDRRRRRDKLDRTAQRIGEPMDLDGGIEAWRESAARAAIARAQGQDALPIAWPAVQLLADPAARSEALGTRPEILAAAAAHLGRAKIDEALGDFMPAIASALRETLSANGRTRTAGEAVRAYLGGDRSWESAVASWAADLGSRLRETLQVAYRAAADLIGGQRHSDAGPPFEEKRDLAQEWLATTDDVLAPQAFVERWQTFAEASPVFPRPERFRAAGGAIAGLELTALLAERVRVTDPHRAFDPRAKVYVLRAPGDVRLLPSRLELGWVSDAAAIEGVARALMAALALAAHPAPIRHSVVGTPALALAYCAGQMCCEPKALVKLGLTKREAEDVARRAAQWSLIRSRLAAQSVLVGALGVNAPGSLGTAAYDPAAQEEFSELILHAWGGGARFRAWRGSFALWDRLRERFDEDWFRNPRAAEAIVAAGERAGLLSIEEWLSELEADEGAASRRVLEVAARAV